MRALCDRRLALIKQRRASMASVRWRLTGSCQCRTSSICLAKWKRHGVLVVLKVYALNRLSLSQSAAAWQEAQLPVLLASSGVPHICKVHWAFQQCNLIVIVQQYCERVFRLA